MCKLPHYPKFQQLLSDLLLSSTGASGYIGGDGLYAVANAHPDWVFSALVRNKEKAAVVSSKYPNIRIVHGDLDSSELIEEEVKKADIVFRGSIIHCTSE